MIVISIVTVVTELLVMFAFVSFDSHSFVTAPRSGPIIHGPRWPPAKQSSTTALFSCRYEVVV